MVRKLTLTTLAFIGALSLAAPAALADECAGWFCDDNNNPAPVPKVGDVGTATIPNIAGAGNDILSGTITEVVPGDHLTLKLPNGELKTLQWAELLQLQISGKIVIGGGGGAATHPPPAPNPPTVVITPPPPKYAPPPPPAYVAPPMYDAPAEPAKPHKSFRERWALGLGLRFVSPSGSSSFIKGGPSMKDYLGGGTAFEGSLGYRIGPSWTMYGFFEYGRFRAGSVNAGGDNSISSTAVGGGMRANTNPDGPLGFFFDIGIGYRWLTLPYDANNSNAMNQYVALQSKTQFSGVEMMRLGLGLSIVASQHVRWDLAFTSSLGSYSKYKNAEGSETIPEDRRGAFAYGGLSIGGQFDM
jgi:hypothetical protein